MSDDEDGKRWDLPPEDKWVEFELMGVAQFFCIHAASGFPVWKNRDGKLYVISGGWWRPLPGDENEFNNLKG